MKLISRKAITATIAAAAITTASMTAPAMAQSESVETTTAVAPAETTTTEDTTADAAPAAAADTDKGSSEDSEGVSGSSDSIFKEGMTVGDKIKEVIAILTGIGAFFGAIITITNNIERLIKNFK